MNKLKLSALGLLAVLSIGLPSLACKGGCKKGKDGEKKAFHHGGGKHFISMADTNKDNKLDLAEMKANAALRFAEGDTNKDGFLEESEIQTQFKNHWKKKDI